MHYLNELLSTLNEMSPYLILGFLISGILHVYVPNSLYAKFLHRKGFGSVMGAAILGVPLPLCSCGVIPTAMSLKKEGASDGATVAFLVGTPQTGVDSILATYSLLGLPFAIIRPVAAFFVAIFSGLTVDKFGTKKKKQAINYSKFTFAPQAAAKPAEPKCSCGCSHENEKGKKEKSIKAVLQYGFVSMMQDFGKWLVIGLLVAAAITAWIPEEYFAMFKEYYFLNILLILLISAPMYICATGSIPVALSLIIKGVSPGAVFVLLMAGPATNVASLIILRKGIGARKTWIYLGSIIIGAIVCALIIDKLLPPEWFTGLEPLTEHEHHNHENCTHGPIWWQTTTSVLFIVLFLNAMIRKYLKRSKSCCSH
ncbi:MAG: SO_0444 family Cu/Zn efflux transporter [Rikenellaceae bacterium]